MKHEVAKPTPEEDLLADLPKDRGWAWVCLAGEWRTRRGCLLVRRSPNVCQHRFFMKFMLLFKCISATYFNGASREHHHTKTVYWEWALNVPHQLRVFLV